MPEEPTPKSPVHLTDVLNKSREVNHQDPIKAIKTYQSDVAEAIKRDNVSVIKMALAEKRRQERQGTTSENVNKESKKRLIYIVSSVALILIGGGLLVFFYIFSQGPGTSAVVTLPKNIIYIDKNVEIRLDNGDSKTIIAGVAAAKIKTLSQGSIENLFITTKGSATSTARRLINAKELIDLFSQNIPAPLFRSLQDPFILGLYKNSTGPDIFLVLKTDSYQNAFAGMLSWERWLDSDMGGLFSIPMLGNNNDLSTPRPFVDRVVANHDTRSLIDDNGNVVLLYSFLDSETLVMSTSENSFKEILARYIATQHEK